MSTDTTTKTDRKAEAAAALDKMHARLAEGILSDGDMKTRLRFLSRLHNYSPRNALLLEIQWEMRQEITAVMNFIEMGFLGGIVSRPRPPLTYVGAASMWKEMGGYIRKGEKALTVLAPIFIKDKENLDEDGNPKKVLIGYRLINKSFEFSQIEGVEAPPEISRLLEGEGPEGVYDLLVALVGEIGFTLKIGPVPFHPSANGQCDHSTKTLTLRPDLSPAQSVKTLVHEIAHALLHGEGRESMHRPTVEVEAESTAFAVCDLLGFDTSDYSLGYVQSWSKGDGALIASTVQRSIAATERITDYLRDGKVPTPVTAKPYEPPVEDVTAATAA